MKHLIESPDLCIKDTGTIRGRGVFAKRPFAVGEIVEVAPVLVMKADFDDLPELLKTYVFNWTALTRVPGRQAVAFGYGSMYNHDNPANLRYEADAREEVMRYIAARDIETDEELTINYDARNGASVSEDDDWFDRMGIDRIQVPETDD